MLFSTPMVISVFLLGAASGALLVTLRYIAFRNRIRAEVAEDLRRALFRRHRDGLGALQGGRSKEVAVNFDSYGVAAEANDNRVRWP